MYKNNSRFSCGNQDFKPYQIGDDLKVESHAVGFY